ncbi:hypothetical protein BDZ89DRAFT_1141415 [Hymenopellis radicata]|nr:hypothetical protein BDZ89DRAFT_1141415 [Hymenopellis radicata]
MNRRQQRTGRDEVHYSCGGLRTARDYNVSRLIVVSSFRLKSDMVFCGERTYLVQSPRSHLRLILPIVFKMFTLFFCTYKGCDVQDDSFSSSSRNLSSSMSTAPSTPATPKPDGKTVQRKGVDQAISARLIHLRSVLNLDYPTAPTKRIGRAPHMSNGSAKQLVPGDVGFEDVGRWVYFLRAEPHLKVKGYVDHIGKRIPLDVLENDTELKSLWVMRRMFLPTPRSQSQPDIQPTPPSSPLRSSPTPVARRSRGATKRARQDADEDAPSTKKAKVLEVIDISDDEEPVQNDVGEAGPSKVLIILLIWRTAKAFPVQVAVEADPQGMLKLGVAANLRRLHEAGITNEGLFRRYVPQEHDWRMSPWELAFPVSKTSKVVAMKIDDLDVFAEGCGWKQFKKMFIE